LGTTILGLDHACGEDLPPTTPLSMSQDPSQHAPGVITSDDDIDDDIKDARKKFLKRFHEGHFPSALGADAEKHRDKIFMKTLHNAITVEGFKWNDPKNKKARTFALGRVTEIASVARYKSESYEISLDALKWAEERVIGYWNPKCVSREIFCKLYKDG
jgi:hypothetical protein